jgi:hypothetical protein
MQTPASHGRNEGWCASTLAGSIEALASVYYALAVRMLHLSLNLADFFKGFRPASA